MKVSILGYGTVGRGVYEAIQPVSTLECTKVLDRPGVFDEPFIVNDIKEISGDKEIETVVECIGGTELPYKFAKECLENKKNFVTSNKALVSKYGLELNQLAHKNNCAFLFSAACGGSMPVLLNLSIAKQSDTIISAGGILNGTVNFMLTKMQDENLAYNEALSLAQKSGYAEADPTADVSGLDTLRKIILISAVGFDTFYQETEMLCEGIQNVDSDVLKTLKSNKLVLRLLGYCGLDEKNNNYAYVQPVAFKEGAQEAGIKQNLNMAFWCGKNCGKMTISGQGAGRYPTASNVLRDLTEILGTRKYMLSENCVEQKNEKTLFAEKECSFLVIENGKAEFTDPVAVYKMHERARESREKGNKFFFAQLEQ